MATETARTGERTAASASEHLTREDRVGLLRAMLLMRGIEERAMMLYRQGKVPGSFYDGFGAGGGVGRRRPGRCTAATGSASCTATSPRT